MKRCHMDGAHPMYCDRCGVSLDRGWSERWSGKTRETMKRTEVICFGCDRAECLDEWRKTGVLSSKLMMDAALKVLPPDANNTINAAAEEIRYWVKLFESKVWFDGLQRYVQGDDRRGHSCKVNRIDWLVWSCIGRCMVTLRQGDVDVTVICAEDGSESTMGLQSITATKDQAISLIVDAIMVWPVGLRPDVNVGMG